MSAGRLFWPVFAVTAAVYLAMMLRIVPGIRAGAGGLIPFDLRPQGYSGDRARAFPAALTSRLRALYLGPQNWLDLAYPALLALTPVPGFRVRVGERARWLGSIGVLAAVAAAFPDDLERTPAWPGFWPSPAR